jgi:Retroviral aspartyl protease
MCSVDDTQSDTLSHHFDCLITTLQTNEVATSTEADEWKRLEPLVDAFFVEGDDEWSIHPNSESSVRPMASIYNEVLAKTPDSKLAPLTILLVHKLQGQTFNRPLRALLDSGSEITLIQKRCIPSSVAMTASKRTIRGVNKEETKTFEVTLDEMSLPELSLTKRITYAVQASIMDTQQNIDAIIGRDMLMALGISINMGPTVADCNIQWQENYYPFTHRDSVSSQRDLLEHTFEIFAETHDVLMAEGITESKYEASDTDAIAQAQTHLSETQQTIWQQK